MASGLQKRERNDQVAAMKSTARLRARVLAILHAGQERAQLNQVEIAAKLGVRKSAVNQVFHGAGNIHIDTLGEYLAALGLEADLVVAELGEFRNARAHRRAPVTIPLTTADIDRLSDGSLALQFRVRPVQSASTEVNRGTILGITELKLHSSQNGRVHTWS